MTEIEQKAIALLNAHNISFVRVWEYIGCTEEQCGPLPRVTIKFYENSVPICYNIDELNDAIASLCAKNKLR